MHLFKEIEHSRTTLAELMIPSYANLGGKIHGGILLSLMDKVAYICAASHSNGYCVTASVDGVDFLNPIEVGDLVKLNASINYTGTSSMVVGIQVISENFKTGTVKHTNKSYFTMVAVDEITKKTRPVPGLKLKTKEDIRRFLEAIKRIELKQDYKKEITAMEIDVKHLDQHKMLQGRNCEYPSGNL